MLHDSNPPAYVGTSPRSMTVDVHDYTLCSGLTDQLPALLDCFRSQHRPRASTTPCIRGTTVAPAESDFNLQQSSLCPSTGFRVRWRRQVSAEFSTIRDPDASIMKLELRPDVLTKAKYIPYICIYYSFLQLFSLSFRHASPIIISPVILHN